MANPLLERIDCSNPSPRQVGDSWLRLSNEDSVKEDHGCRRRADRFDAFSNDRDNDKAAWTLAYDSFDPKVEGRREALFTVGNGCFATRGAAANEKADGVHYPGTYLAGGYNRLTTQLAGCAVENEDLVNLPNWLPVEIGTIQDGSLVWFKSQGTADIVDYRQHLDLRGGIYNRSVRYRDAKGRLTRIDEQRFVHMEERHLAGQQVTVTPENWSGPLTIRVAIDGRICNAGVPRYRPFDNHHLTTVEAVSIAETMLLEAVTTQSRLHLVEASRVRFYCGDELIDSPRHAVSELSYIGQQVDIEMIQGGSVSVEKIVALFTSRDQAITDPRTEALTTIERAGALSRTSREPYFCLGSAVEALRPRRNKREG